MTDEDAEKSFNLYKSLCIQIEKNKIPPDIAFGALCGAIGYIYKDLGWDLPLLLKNIEKFLEKNPKTRSIP